MAPKKASAKASNVKKTGKSGSDKYVDEHPELQTNYWKFQVMTYDSAVGIHRNKIENMLQSLQSYLIPRNFTGNQFPVELLIYLNQLRTMSLY